MSLKLKPKNRPEPFRTILMGREGVGKSTFAGLAPDPIAISPENGMERILNRKGERIDIADGVETFSQLVETCRSLMNEKFQTLILDTADWVEKACHTEIIGTSKKDIIRVNGGYGAGYAESVNRHLELISVLNQLVFQKGMNVIVTSHYKIGESKDPEAVSDYDCYIMKCHKDLAPVWREWADAVLFCKFETHVKVGEKDEKTFATGTDRRLLYTRSRPAFPEAKNRFGLPFEMPLDYFEFEKLVTDSSTVDEILSELNALAEKIPADDKERMTAAIAASKNDRTKLISIRNHARKKVT